MHKDSVNKRLGALIWHRMVRVYKNNTKQTSALLDKLQLTNAQFDVISTIARNEYLTQQVLAKHLLVTKGNITQLLYKLEQRGLIQKRKEWRTNYISLTEDGKAMYEEVLPHLQQFQSNFFSNLTEDERKQFLILLKKVNQDAEEAKDE